MTKLLQASQIPVGDPIEQEIESIKQIYLHLLSLQPKSRMRVLLYVEDLLNA